LENEFPNNGTTNLPDAALRSFLDSAANESENLLADLLTAKILRRSSFSAQKTVCPPHLFDFQLLFKFRRAFVA